MDDVLLMTVGWVIVTGMLLGSVLGWSFIIILGLHTVALRIGDLFDRRSSAPSKQATVGSIEGSAS